MLSGNKNSDTSLLQRCPLMFLQVDARFQMHSGKGLWPGPPRSTCGLGEGTWPALPPAPWHPRTGRRSGSEPWEAGGETGYLSQTLHFPDSLATSLFWGGPPWPFGRGPGSISISQIRKLQPRGARMLYHFITRPVHW